ncbi:hypothetical protein [Fimbriiglobus ruber]|uniref:Tetratricopeptide repeat protein n=1 Tax=Fimbriiglobus ruber TaxID=1908690 RepID=A0A225DMK4_9BACT|nr:hypothetical protein [Fimbriiglobus ruber]OWK38459.1 hypothetical protein FRUB_07579 [Fimbriiglobus ruber]
MGPAIDIYRQYLLDMLRVYAHLDHGTFDSEEADEIRDAMEMPWYSLSEAEQKRIRGLALDLNYNRDLKRNLEGPIERGRPKLVAAANLRDKGELDQALTLLRESQNEIYPPFLSFLRGRIWMGFEVPEVAADFLRDAWQLAKANENLQGMYLQVLRQANFTDAKKMADAIVASPSTHSVMLLAFALEIESAAIQHSDAEAREQHKRLIPLLVAAIHRLLAGEQPFNPPVLSMCVVLLAESYESLGMLEEARDALTFAMNLEGDSPILYAARGKLLYPKEEGVTDLLRAIQMGIPAVWPYLWVAIVLLDQGQYQACIEICDAGAVRKTSSRIKSELLELGAIARASLRYPNYEVNRQFSAAIEADPSNIRARQNSEIFQLTTNTKVSLDKIEKNELQYKWSRIPEEYFKAIEKREREKLFAYSFN